MVLKVFYYISFYLMLLGGKEYEIVYKEYFVVLKFLKIDIRKGN